MVVLGRRIEGILSVKYKVTVEKTPSFGRGKRAHSIQNGNETIEGELMLLQSELKALTDIAQVANPLNKVTDISFDIIVAYDRGGTVVTDIIQGAEFTEYEKGMEQGDPQMEVTLPFIALDVLENA